MAQDCRLPGENDRRQEIELPAFSWRGLAEGCGGAENWARAGRERAGTTGRETPA
jgi:hypothetical protein